VLATVTAGVWFGWHAHEMFDADTRLNALAFWQALVFGLRNCSCCWGCSWSPWSSRRGAHRASPRCWGRLAPAALKADTGETWLERLVVGWSSMRGAISLAAALAVLETVSGGGVFPERDDDPARSRSARGAPAQRLKAQARLRSD